MPLRVRDTFFMGNTGGIANPAGAHLMVCLMIKATENKAAIVPIISRHQFSDASCVLNVGDHPFITHESCAAYDHLKIVSISETEAQLQSGILRSQAPISAALLIRLQVGLVTTDEVAPWAFDEANGDALHIWLKHKGHI